MRIGNYFKTFALTAVAVTAVSLAKPVAAQTVSRPDTFERSISPKGNTDSTILVGAPSPEVTITGEKKNAKIVVDLAQNVLYKYNDFGVAESAYLVASGAEDTPTTKGVRIVTHTETYPYKSAPESSKRRRTPAPYGPRIICLNMLDPETGEQRITGEFIHGNNDPSSIGKYASHGCVRMDNDVIKILANEVKRGDIVIVQ